MRKEDSDSFDVKVDHEQTVKDRFSVRYSFQRPVVTDPGRFGIYGGGGKAFAATGINRTQSTAVNYTRLFSSTFILEARVGLSRYSNVATNLDSGTKLRWQYCLRTSFATVVSNFAVSDVIDRIPCRQKGSDPACHDSSSRGYM